MSEEQAKKINYGAVVVVGVVTGIVFGVLAGFFSWGLSPIVLGFICGSIAALALSFFMRKKD